jgi:hypothetical protein
LEGDEKVKNGVKKAQRENAPHFFYFVPLSLGGYPFFAAKQ